MPDARILSTWMAARDGSAGAQLLRDAGADTEVAWAANATVDPHALLPLDAYAADSEGRQVKGLPLRIGGAPCPGFRAAPLLGEDNEDVATQLLGVSPSELEALVAQSVLAKRPLKAG
jgi:crotonobetainyl-CoA:carnitine CoA-transferase CaiB-like acyl-CoA transferase